ncbi:acyl-CoA dehydrogenase family protein [Bradyrhizobium tropiciagri]|uniref:acyl-CoA dehydrogenase family protein n=1 Tax=Bradyrhizobium tropiciagri TaxID=312253 RepID=UPI001BA97E74|nr:acyl-CoA dehydrogenase family protein [Bradyrhizobium tropiciagri]MBR0874931.1 acyl-CoA dehydrogenase family protein [Bradyrhizobium tropiciagri]
MDGLPNAMWQPAVEAGFVDEVRRFVKQRIVPLAHEIDAKDLYPAELVRDLAKLGCNAISLPKTFGGRELGYAHSVAACEEIGYGSAAVAICLITIFQAQTMLNTFGSDSLKQRYLPQFAQGLIASYALTEASHGSDIRKLDTKACRDGDGWLLNGEKSFITSGSRAELFVILAQTDVGVSVFVVPRETAGVSTYIGENSATFGLRNGPHVNVRLQDVRLPFDHLIGQEGKGVRQAVTTLDYSRTVAAGISVGIARAAFDAALAFARDRTAFDQKVVNFQGIQWYFADMLAKIDAARLLVYDAARALDTHDDVIRRASAAKLMASEVATEVAARCVQICGAYGTMVNAPFGRFMRDAKTYEIGGGSSEVLKNALAKRVVSYAAEL